MKRCEACKGVGLQAEETSPNLGIEAVLPQKCDQCGGTGVIDGEGQAELFVPREETLALQRQELRQKVQALTDALEETQTKLEAIFATNKILMMVLKEAQSATRGTYIGDRITEALEGLAL